MAFLRIFKRNAINGCLKDCVQHFGASKNLFEPTSIKEKNKKARRGGVIWHHLLSLPQSPYCIFKQMLYNAVSGTRKPTKQKEVLL